MSYGWLTESTLPREKSKKIKIDGSSMIGIEAVLAADKLKLKKNEHPQHRVTKEHKIVARNPGIQVRMLADANAENTEQSKLRDTQNIMQHKTKFYSRLQQNPINHGSLLVDFISKSLNEEDEDYEQLKKQFYDGKLDEIRLQRRTYNEEDKGVEKDYHQRLAWEKDLLLELKGHSIEEKIKVLQSFDHKLSKDEKEALEDIIEEAVKAQQRREEIKMQRKEENEQRIRKLKKMNILDS